MMMRISHNYIMSRPLWQAIGIQANSPKTALSQNNKNIIHYSGSNASGVRHEQQHNKHPSVHFALPPASNDQIGAQPHLEQQIENDLSIEIESCESQQLISPTSKDIPWCSSKFFIEKTFKTRVKNMNQQVKTIHQEVQILKSNVSQGLRALSGDVATAINKIYNRFSKQLQKQPQMSACQRCEHSKAMVDLLTRQCWELEGKLKAKEAQVEALKIGQKVQSREEHPMKKIQSSLLQERAETIKRLKAEIQTLKQQNESIYQQVRTKDQKLKDLESQYRSSLISFKGEIESINEACCSKMQRVLQEKAASESEFKILQEKYIELQESCGQEHLQRTKKRYFTQLPEPLGYSPSAVELETAFSKHTSLRNQQKATFGNALANSHHNINSLIDLQLNNTAPLSWQPFKPDNRQSTVRYSNKTKSPYRVPSKNLTIDLTPSLKWKSYLQSTPQSRKSHNTSQSSFSSAMQKLVEIQKDVRKEINRSKKSFK